MLRVPFKEMYRAYGLRDAPALKKQKNLNTHVALSDRGQYSTHFVAGWRVVFFDAGKNRRGVNNKKRQ